MFECGSAARITIGNVTREECRAMASSLRRNSPTAEHERRSTCALRSAEGLTALDATYRLGADDADLHVRCALAGRIPRDYAFPHSNISMIALERSYWREFGAEEEPKFPYRKNEMHYEPESKLSAVQICPKQHISRCFRRTRCLDLSDVRIHMLRSLPCRGECLAHARARPCDRCSLVCGFTFLVFVGF